MQVRAMQTECPDCGGPAVYNRAGTRLLWHQPWRVGRGGRLFQRAADLGCTGRPDPGYVPVAQRFAEERQVAGMAR